MSQPNRTQLFSFVLELTQIGINSFESKLIFFGKVVVLRKSLARVNNLLQKAVHKQNAGELLSFRF